MAGTQREEKQLVTAQFSCPQVVFDRFRLSANKFEEGRLMTVIDANQIEQLVPVSHPDVRRLLGIEHCADPDQAARRMVRCGVPHLRIGRRIRFSLPALQKWAAEQIAQSVPERAEAEVEAA